jgi:hypothetical protein
LTSTSAAWERRALVIDGERVHLDAATPAVKAGLKPVKRSLEASKEGLTDPRIEVVATRGISALQNGLRRLPSRCLRTTSISTKITLMRRV